MKVYLFNFAKRSNSTLHPELTDGKQFDCELFEPFTITAPTLLLKDSNTIFNFNYAYIPDLNSRYYFVNEWTFDNGIWQATTCEDLLASWRGTILESSQYVERSSVEKDGYIPDNLYPYTLQGLRTLSYKGSQPSGAVYKWKSPEQLGNDDLNLYVNGAFLGYIPENRFELPTEGQRADNYKERRKTNSVVVFKNEQLENLLSSLQDEDNSKVRFSDYIKRIYTMPVAPNPIQNGLETEVKKCALYYGSLIKAVDADFTTQGDYAVSFMSFPTPEVTPDYPWTPNKIMFADMLGLRKNTTAYCEWTINRGSSWSSLSPYLKSSEYTKMFIKFNPFGTIEIDPNYFLTQNEIELKTDIDLQTGDAILYLKRESTYIPIASTNVAVDIQIGATWNNSTQRMRNFTAGTIALATTVASAAVGLAGVASTNATIGAMLSNPEMSGRTAQRLIQTREANTRNATNSLINASGSTASTLNNMLAPMQTGCSISGMPGCSLIDDAPMLIITRYETVETDSDKFGCMLMQRNRKLAELQGGFIKCIDAKTPRATMLASEQNAVENLLNSGIYLE